MTKEQNFEIISDQLRVIRETLKEINEYLDNIQEATIELNKAIEWRGKWEECKTSIPIPRETLHIADGIMFCSECKYLALQRLVYEDGNGDLRFIKSNYCPNCGAHMEE